MLCILLLTCPLVEPFVPASDRYATSRPIFDDTHKLQRLCRPTTRQFQPPRLWHLRIPRSLPSTNTSSTETTAEAAKRRQSGFLDRQACDAERAMDDVLEWGRAVFEGFRGRGVGHVGIQGEFLQPPLRLIVADDSVAAARGRRAVSYSSSREALSRYMG